MMNYPTLEQVEIADRYQLALWYRFLPSPGMGAIDKDNFEEVMNREVALMNKICERFKDLGGMTPEISKSIGWEKL